MLADDWHVYAPDFRGHGKSGRVPGAYKLADYVRDTAAFLAGVLGEPAVENLLWHRLAGRPANEIEPELRAMPIRRTPGEALRPAREIFGEDNPWFAFMALSLHQLDPDMLAAVLGGPE